MTSRLVTPNAVRLADDRTIAATSGWLLPARAVETAPHVLAPGGIDRCNHVRTPTRLLMVRLLASVTTALLGERRATRHGAVGAMDVCG